ncbi:hypothetical protein OIU34_10915 [Pararhizobium sp. BT-229]|uniref:hypothetical protein n=1 Tax=Pararhizobium sp. BT-229 TaxID=2986923 RepID=UPI0021F7EB69|nr:hypothetical protein [Pararhizobium sp. BT-229]MCV9962411.1 hypothetical protein [Pararhizobium sp. BT-229]
MNVEAAGRLSMHSALKMLSEYRPPLRVSRRRLRAVSIRCLVNIQGSEKMLLRSIFEWLKIAQIRQLVKGSVPRAADFVCRFYFLFTLFSGELGLKG